MKQLLIILFLLCNLFFLQAQNNEVALLNSAPNTAIADTKWAMNSDMTYVPFDLVDGKILVKARVNGQYGTFMLDTGAPGIVINEKVKKDRTTKKGNGVTGELEVLEKTINNFEWAGIETGKMNVLALDMSHFEIAKKHQLLGLIGYDILKNLEVLFDFERQVIILTKTNNLRAHKTRKPTTTLHFELNGHLPIVRAKIGKKTVYLGLDSGAQSNLLDPAIIQKLDEKLITQTAQEVLVGLDKEEQLTEALWLSETNLNKTVFTDMKYVAADLSAFNTPDNLKIDGLLGLPFFQSKQISINYSKQKIYIW